MLQACGIFCFNPILNGTPARSIDFINTDVEDLLRFLVLELKTPVFFIYIVIS
jgi:hypothetical protein